MTTESRAFFRTEFLAPRYWSVWLLFGLMLAISRLPYRLAMPLGRTLGRIGLHLARYRRHIAETNLALCFPESSPATRESWLRQHFQSLGMAAIETSILWMGDEDKVEALLKEVVGMNNLERALEQGRGAILLAGHFTHLEMGAVLLAKSRALATAAVYRPHKDTLFEAIMARSRTRYGRAIRRDDARAMLRALQDGLPMWYAPDQNYTGVHGEFSPFFGIAAATNAAAGRIARMSRAPVLPFRQERLADDCGYRLIISPALETFPVGDSEVDAATVNRIIEGMVRIQPADYLWVHRRFKSRPNGDDKVYRSKPRRRRRRGLIQKAG